MFLRLFSLLALILPLFHGALLLQGHSHVIGDSEARSSMGFLGGGVATEKAASKGHVPLDVDGYPVAPAELELQQVHIYVRHGTSFKSSTLW